MAKIILSGWLPGEEKQGLTALADEVAAAARKPNRKNPVEYVVIGVVRAHTVKQALDTDDEPIYTMQVQSLEPVDGDEAAELRERIVALREKRAGVQDTLDSGSGAPVPLPGG
jgi:hypothetical protein